MTLTTEPPLTTSSAAAPPASGRPRPGLLTGLSHVALVVWALLVVLPLLWTLLASFKDNTEIFGDALQLPAELRWDNWARAWSKANVGTYLLNTVIVVAAGTFGTMLLGSMAAYVLARYRFPGNRLIYYLFVSGMAFPVFLALVPLFFVVDQVGLLNTHTGLVLVYIAYSLPFTIFFLASFFKTLPTSVAEAAMIDGASHVRTFFQVMLPMARPGLVSITIFNVLGQWNQYLLPLVLLSGAKDKWVITQGIADISTIAGYEADWPGLFAALSMSIIPVVVVYAVFQRQIQSGLTSGALK
ncbi:carbohydrate ABC transporter permease [Streptosporangium carneum]|uniref:Sugar ABC transporter permease n=1 Tax=Streptosporangium carneum TaxID=47481 RepID=A0A9W6MD76_9ACTN|nr:carbohydrate ABC transporter permease [Streptosporangium carneum]GLK09792.1 sugar ABC transporter permease [Streptosporangium carneum]